MHINSFHLTNFHSCMPVLIRQVWIMVQFYMSCAVEFFFPTSFLYARSTTKCLQITETVFQFEGMKWTLKRPICCVHILQPFLPNKPSDPPETTTSHLSKDDWKIRYYLLAKHKNLASKRGLPTPVQHAQWTDSFPVLQTQRRQSMYYKKNVLEHRGCEDKNQYMQHYTASHLP